MADELIQEKRLETEVSLVKFTCTSKIHRIRHCEQIINSLIKSHCILKEIVP